MTAEQLTEIIKRELSTSMTALKNSPFDWELQKPANGFGTIVDKAKPIVVKVNGTLFLITVKQIELEKQSCE